MKDITLEDIQQTIPDEELDEAYNELTPKQKKYIDEFMVDMDYIQAYKRVYKIPKVDTSLSADEQREQQKDIDKRIRGRARRLLTQPKIASSIRRNLTKLHNSKIMSAQEILEMYSSIAKGEVLDQFGLEASLADRIKALEALAKRQIDFQQKLDSNTPRAFEVHIVNTADINK